MDIVLTPKQVTRFFALTVIFLTLAHLAGQFSTYVLGYDNIFGIIPMFSLNREENIPALYSTLSLLFCGLLLAIIAAGKNRKRAAYRYHWAGLAALFIYLSMDEALSFHESSTRPLRSALNTEGALFYAWIIPYSIGLVLLLLIYIKFILNLPGKTRSLLLLAGIVFVAGAIGMELVAGPHDAQFGRDNPVYSLYSTIEEVLEMSGIVIFIYALLSYITSELNEVRITISDSREKRSI